MAKATKQTEEGSSKFQETLKALEKKYGSGTVIQGKDVKEDIEVVPSGSLTLDIATNLGGHPVGKLIEIFGPESSGKSTIVLHAIANFQKLPGECVLVDFEQSFDRVYATSLGVDVNRLVIIQPECMEDGYNIIIDLIKTGDIRFIAIDSHTAAMPKKIVDGEVGDVTIGLQARVNSTSLGKIKPLLRANRCTMLAIAQLRTAVGNYGNPEQPTGGLAYKFYADLRYRVFKQLDKENSSNKTTIEVIKNKCAIPFGKAVFSIDWGIGINRIQEVIDLAVEHKLLNKGGAWFTLEGGAKIQGDNGMRDFLRDNIEFAKKLEQDVLNKINS